MIWFWLNTWKSLLSAEKIIPLDQRSQFYGLFTAVKISLVVYFFFSLSLSNQTSRLLWFLFALGTICFNIAKDTYSVEIDPVHSVNLKSQKQPIFSIK